MGFVADNGLSGPSSASRYVSPASTEGAPPKTARQIADEAKEAAEKAAVIEKAQISAEAAYTTLESELGMALTEEDLKEERIKTPMDAMNAALKTLAEEVDRKGILKTRGIYTPNGTGTPTYVTTLGNTIGEEGFRIFYEDTVLKIEAIKGAGDI